MIVSRADEYRLCRCRTLAIDSHTNSYDKGERSRKLITECSKDAHQVGQLMLTIDAPEVDTAVMLLVCSALRMFGCCGRTCAALWSTALIVSEGLLIVQDWVVPTVNWLILAFART